jgi:thiamine monophosphate kinase
MVRGGKLMKILGRPYVFGDPEQTKWIQEQYKKEDLQKQIIDGLQLALEGVEDYVYFFTSTEELRKTIKDATKKLNYMSGSLFDEELLEVHHTYGNLNIEWYKSQ